MSGGNSYGTPTTPRNTNPTCTHMSWSHGTSPRRRGQLRGERLGEVERNNRKHNDRANSEKKTSSVRRRTTSCSTVHPVNFVEPKVLFALYGGVTRIIGEKLHRLGLCNTDSDDSDSSSTDEVSFKRRFTEDPQSKDIFKDYEVSSTFPNLSFDAKV
ncbi:hypothetical protein MAR_006397 [Mya arenaria]|uniref:Uncharacterized protein n=1 Tax=Mya arenaria TaxID=6604 RepID=A0ABY7DC35_MYAAR|nr:hypothetical protein MAR_006396 [Mya arenaria]WAQ93926.1 hypothetical protein MAR_006397 [Mya arenaria]